MSPVSIREGLLGWCHCYFSSSASQDFVSSRVSKYWTFRELEVAVKVGLIFISPIQSLSHKYLMKIFFWTFGSGWSLVIQWFAEQKNQMIKIWPSLKSALRPPPSALAESANFRPFYVKRADFSPPPPATKKRRKLVKIRPRCPHLATKKRRKVVKIRPCGGWWVGGCPPPFCLNLILSSNRSKYGKI